MSTVIQSDSLVMIPRKCVGLGKKYVPYGISIKYFNQKFISTCTLETGCPPLHWHPSTESSPQGEMEVNKDEAIRCLSISQKHIEAGNFPSARKFCLKSIALFETPEARKVLDQIDNLANSSSNMAGSAGSQTEEHTSAAGMKHRHAQPRTSGNANGTASGMGSEKREYTAEQAAVVKRVKSCKATAYYEILLVKKDCDEAEIKKAYRKVSSKIVMFYLIIYCY